MVSMKHSLGLYTYANPVDGQIHQDLVEEHDGYRKVIAHYVLHTRDQKIAESLIQLGWTPPVPDGKPGDLLRLIHNLYVELLHVVDGRGLERQEVLRRAYDYLRSAKWPMS